VLNVKSCDKNIRTKEKKNSHLINPMQKKNPLSEDES
jgi:hypothetical protein